MELNRVAISGYLVKKPEGRRLPSGTQVANVRLGQTHRYQDGNKQPQEHTNWHSLSFYGDLANTALTFEKGNHLYIEGSIEQRQFTPKDGSARTITEIVVRYCHLIAASNRTQTALSNLPEGGSDNDAWPVR